MASSLLSVLHRYWGYSSFRPLQEQVVNSLLAGRDACVVMPTGGGKSLCYQLPAAMMEGRTAIVRRLSALPIEAVVRGYLIGSGWKDYQKSGSVCGIALPPGMKQAERLPTPLFTPASKAAPASP